MGFGRNALLKVMMGEYETELGKLTFHNKTEDEKQFKDEETVGILD
jgi:hypothetical protein